MRFALGLAAAFLLTVLSASAVEQWGVFEVGLPGPATGNPFIDVTLATRFTLGDQVIQVEGFYDGGGMTTILRMRAVEPSPFRPNPISRSASAGCAAPPPP